MALGLFVAAELGQAHDDLWRVPLADPLRGLVKLTSGQADEDRPSACRDGRWLVNTDNRSGPTALVVRELASGEEATVQFDTMDYRRPTGTLRLTVKDSASGKPTVARISLREERGRFHAPPGSLHRSLRGRGHFCCDRTALLTVPAGTCRLWGYRGPEYKVASRELLVKAGQTHEVPVELAEGEQPGYGPLASGRLEAEGRAHEVRDSGPGGGYNQRVAPRSWSEPPRPRVRRIRG